MAPPNKSLCLRLSAVQLCLTLSLPSSLYFCCHLSLAYAPSYSNLWQKKNKVAWVSPSATPAAPIAAPTWLHLGFPCNLIYKCPARRTGEQQQQEQELCKVPHHTKATKRERKNRRERLERPNEKDFNKRMRDEPSEESPLAGLSNDWMFIIMMMLIMMMMMLQSAQLKIEIFKFLKLNWSRGEND